MKSICYLLVTSLFLLVNLPLMAAKVIPVTFQTLDQLAFHPQRKAPAQVVTLHNSLLSSELSARVQQVNVQVGDRVVREQVLVRLECVDFELNKQQLLSEKEANTADKQFAQYQYERSTKLLKTKSVSEEAHRRQLAELNRLKAGGRLLDYRIRQAEKEIDRCLVRAPFDGVIAERLVNKGENVAPQSPLVRLIDVDNLEVEVQMPVMMIDELQYNSLDFIFREQRYPLKLRAVIPSIETRARHQRVRLQFLGQKALPNAFGMAEITLKQWYIPASYLVKRQSQVGLFIVDEMTGTEQAHHFKARFHPLRGAMIGRDAMVNLPLDTRVIIDGRFALTDDQPVQLQSSEPDNQ